MSNEQQGTFGESVGMEPLVPTGPHRDDRITTEDGVDLAWCDALTDCNGQHWADPELRDERDIEAVSDILDKHVAWASEYATENDDYTSGYDHIISEVRHEWADRIGEWFSDKFEDFTGHSKYDDCKDRLIEAMCDGLEGEWDGDWHYGGNEYASYSGPGCCIWGFDIGECEEQVEVKAVAEFAELHSQGRLRDILDRTNCDAYVSLSDYSLRGDHPCFEFYHNPGGRWDFVVSEDKMDELMIEAIIQLCRS